MKSTQEKHWEVIEHLKEKYRLSKNELKIIEKIKEKTILCVSFTTDGGFNCESGEFYMEEDESSFKIKIKYEEKASSNINEIYLMPSTASVF